MFLHHRTKISLLTKQQEERQLEKLKKIVTSTELYLPSQDRRGAQKIKKPRNPVISDSSSNSSEEHEELGIPNN